MIRVLAAGVSAAALAAAPAAAQDHAHHAHHDHSAAPAEAPADPHAGHVMPAEAPHAAHAMTGALGPYPMTREAAGTAWQPDAGLHPGRHIVRGDWTLMGHLALNAVHDWQAGPRGDEMDYLAGMAMGMARRGFSNGDALQLRAMLSPDPFMGKRGLPILLGSGETADGVTPLVDRQHPHDLFMELSASYSKRLSERSSLFVYGGLPGEPAFGPPAFMHRMSIMDSPEPPISHHWLDSTHITFGVVTAGVVAGDWKLEASRFRGREPDERRFDIETGPLDSTAIRASWNPTPEWSLQASYADVTSPEQLEPDDDQTKWSASAIYTRRIGEAGWWSTTAAWGRRSGDHDDLDAWVLESAVKPNARWTIFARAERTETNELSSAGGHHGPTFTVGKASVGVIRDWTVGEGVTVGVGGLYAMNFLPAGLEASYGGDPDGAMAFVRLKVE
jgi:hypothetical protein